LNKVTILGTMHKEKGKCNVNNLYKIIEEINPNVIFEENNIDIKKFDLIISTGIFGSNIDNILQNENIERKTIRKYLINHNIETLSVATLDTPKWFDEYDNILFGIIPLGDKKYVEYKDHCEYIINYISENGFENINTNEFDNLINKKLQLQKEYVHNTPENIKYYDEYMEFIHNKREIEIINNIVKYIFESKIQINAVLLIGAEHRISLMKKLENIKNIDFDFYYNNKSNGT